MTNRDHEHEHEHDTDEERERCEECNGSEVKRDLQRDDRGPTYHGGDWDLANREADRPHGDENVDEDGEVDGKGDGDRITDPGTRGAVHGKHGDGLVEREDSPKHYANGRWEYDSVDRTRGKRRS